MSTMPFMEFRGLKKTTEKEVKMIKKKFNCIFVLQINKIENFKYDIKLYTLGC